MDFYFQDQPYFNPVLRLDDEQLSQKIDQRVDGYRFSINSIDGLKKLFDDELRRSIRPDCSNGPKPMFPMFNTFVTRFPTGTEVGKYLGLDIGGTNLRVVLVELMGNGSKPQLQIQNFSVPYECRQSNGKKFFDYLAKCIGTFLAEHLPSYSEPLSLGFTFSFGFDQLAINRGRVVQFGIATNLPDVIGKDPVALLQKSLDDLSLAVKVVALANDSTSTLVYGRYLNQQTNASLILGSGSNVAYVESVDKFPKLTNPSETFGDESVKNFICNSECVLFGDDGVMDHFKTAYDQQLDQASLFPKSYTYEKLVGGAFLGELLRYTMIDCITNGKLLLNGKSTAKLEQSGSVLTAHMSTIEQELLSHSEQGNQTEATFSSVQDLLRELDYGETDFNVNDCKIIAHICQLITIRTAILCAIALSSFVDHMSDCSEVMVACDGSLYKKHPKMHTLINEYLRMLCPGKKVSVFLADSGSSIGAALIASCYSC